MNKKMLITFLCFSAISPMMAQDIKGKIVDEKDQPLASGILCCQLWLRSNGSSWRQGTDIILTSL